MPAWWQARISGLLKYPRSATASSVSVQNSFRLPGHLGQLSPIRAAVRYLVRHNQMVLGIHGDLHL